MLDEYAVKHQMAALDSAVKLPPLELGKVGRFDRDPRVIRRNDLESVAVIGEDELVIVERRAGEPLAAVLKAAPSLG